MPSPHRVPAQTPASAAIRPATPQDIPQIVAIWGELARQHAGLDPAFATSDRWQEEYRQFVRGLMWRDDALAVVAVEEDQVVGYAVGRISTLPGFFARRRRGYIHDAVVRRDCRRRGVGRRLVDALREWMAEAGASSVELAVASRNEEAVKFWERLGFVTYMHHMRRDLG